MSNLGPASRFDSGYVLHPPKRSICLPIAFWLVVAIGLILAIRGGVKHYDRINNAHKRHAVSHSAVYGSAAVSMDAYGLQADYWATKGR